MLPMNVDFTSPRFFKGFRRISKSLICYVNLTLLPLAMNLDESWPCRGFRRAQHGAKAKIESIFERERPTLCMYKTN